MPVNAPSVGSEVGSRPGLLLLPGAGRNTDRRTPVGDPVGWKECCHICPGCGKSRGRIQGETIWKNFEEICKFVRKQKFHSNEITRNPSLRMTCVRQGSSDGGEGYRYISQQNQYIILNTVNRTYIDICITYII